MKPKIDMEPVLVHCDPRDSVFEPLSRELLAAQQNVHVAISEPGCVRGNHYHRHATEIIVLVGPALFRLREDGQTRDFQVPEGSSARFIVPPGVSHAILNTGQKPGFLIAFSSIPHDPAHPDTIADKLIEAVV